MSAFIDAADFVRNDLSRSRFPSFLQSPKRRKLEWRILGFRLWLKGILTFGESVQNLRSSHRQPPHIGEKINECLNQKLAAFFERKGIYNEGAVTLFGHPFFPPPENSVDHSWRAGFELIFQCVVQDQYHTAKFLKPNSIVIDAGANAGVFSLLAANCSPQGAAYAFEPRTTTFDVLEKNAAPYANIHPVKAGLGKAVGENTLIFDEGNTGSNTMLDSRRAQGDTHGRETETVKIDTIDNFVAANNISRVDFIKMDTEGYEGSILEGAKETIRKFSPVIAMSAYHHADDLHDLPALVHSIDPGYVCRLYSDAEQDFICTKAA